MISTDTSEQTQQPLSTTSSCINEFGGFSDFYEFRSTLATHFDVGWTWSFWNLDEIGDSFYNNTNDDINEQMSLLEHYNRRFTIQQIAPTYHENRIVTNVVHASKFYYYARSYILYVGDAHYMHVLNDFFYHYMAIVKLLLNNNILYRDIENKARLYLRDNHFLKHIIMSREEIRAWAHQNPPYII